MKLFRILEVVVKTYAFDVKARDNEEALNKIERSCGGITNDIVRCPECDDEISREYQCDDDGD